MTRVALHVIDADASRAIEVREHVTVGDPPEGVSPFRPLGTRGLWKVATSTSPLDLTSCPIELSPILSTLDPCIKIWRTRSRFPAVVVSLVAEPEVSKKRIRQLEKEWSKLTGLTIHIEATTVDASLSFPQVFAALTLCRDPKGLVQIRVEECDRGIPLLVLETREKGTFAASWRTTRLAARPELANFWIDVRRVNVDRGLAGDASSQCDTVDELNPAEVAAEICEFSPHVLNANSADCNLKKGLVFVTANATSNADQQIRVLEAELAQGSGFYVYIERLDDDIQRRLKTSSRLLAPLGVSSLDIHAVPSDPSVRVVFRGSPGELSDFDKRCANAHSKLLFSVHPVLPERRAIAHIDEMIPRDWELGAVDVDSRRRTITCRIGNSTLDATDIEQLQDQLTCETGYRIRIEFQENCNPNLRVVREMLRSQGRYYPVTSDDSTGSIRIYAQDEFEHPSIRAGSAEWEAATGIALTWMSPLVSMFNICEAVTGFEVQSIVPDIENGKAEIRLRNSPHESPSTSAWNAAVLEQSGWQVTFVPFTSIEETLRTRTVSPQDTTERLDRIYRREEAQAPRIGPNPNFVTLPPDWRSVLVPHFQGDLVMQVRAVVPKECGFQGLFIDPVSQDPVLVVRRFRERVNAHQIRSRFGLAGMKVAYPGDEEQWGEVGRSVIQYTQLNRLPATLQHHLATPCEFVAFGGAEQVGPSAYLYRIGSRCILIDLGSSPGSKSRLDFPLSAVTNVDCVIASHGHLDHGGNLATLVRHGYRGPIVGLPETAVILKYMLSDSFYLQSQRDEVPPFVEADIRTMLSQYHCLQFGQEYRFSDKATIVLHPNGHIPGSAAVEIRIEGLGTILHTSDFFDEDTDLLTGSRMPGHADVIVSEGTYGARNHVDSSFQRGRLLDTVNRTLSNRGRVLILAFAIGRSQNTMLKLSSLPNLGIDGDVPVYYDGMIRPMTDFFHRAIKADKSGIYGSAAQQMNDEVFSPQNGRFCRVRDRAAVIKQRGPSVVVTTSGMGEGPAAEYLLDWLDDPLTTVVITGFPGIDTTASRLLQNPEFIEISGRRIRRRATIEYIPSSAHVGQNGILDLVRTRQPKVFLATHGDASALHALCGEVRKLLPPTAHVEAPTRWKPISLLGN